MRRVELQKIATYARVAATHPWAAARDLWRVKAFPHPARCNLLVYTAGKVGSSTISRSLTLSGIPNYHLHYAGIGAITRQIERADAAGEHIRDHTYQSLLARDAVVRNDTVKIITSVREPVARNLSAIFETIGEERDIPDDELKALLDNYRTDIVDNWFKNDFEPFTGIGLAELTMNDGKDHRIVHRGKFEVLILRMETDLARQSDLIGHFLGRSVKLRIANEASNKWYRNIYSSTRSRLPELSPQLVDRSLSAAYFSALYPDGMRKEIAQRHGRSASG